MAYMARTQETISTLRVDNASCEMQEMAVLRHAALLVVGNMYTRQHGSLTTNKPVAAHASAS